MILSYLHTLVRKKSDKLLTLCFKDLFKRLDERELKIEVGDDVKDYLAKRRLQ